MRRSREEVQGGGTGAVELAILAHQLVPPPPLTAACEDDNATYLSMDSPPPRDSSSPESAYSVAATTLPHLGQLRASELPQISRKLRYGQQSKICSRFKLL